MYWAGVIILAASALSSPDEAASSADEAASSADEAAWTAIERADHGGRRLFWTL